MNTQCLKMQFVASFCVCPLNPLENKKLLTKKYNNTFLFLYLSSLMVMDFLYFCLSGNVLISHFYTIFFVRYRILCLIFYSFRILNIFSCEAIWLWGLFLGIFLVTASISVFINGLFIISISSWLSLGRLNFSKNLSVSSRLSTLLPYSCS